MELKPAPPNIQEQLQQRIIQLEQQVADLIEYHQSLLYTVSHDLRTPVMTILGFTDLLIADQTAESPSQTLQYLQHVRQAATKQAKLIDELLKLSRLMHCELRPEPVDLTGLAEYSIMKLRNVEPQRALEVRLNNTPVARVDRELFTLVMDSLLGNAWKFTGKTANPRVEFAANERNGFPVYSVSDNGAGFDPSFSERLFLPLKRLHSEKEFPGLGMGLVTAATIIRRHGGRIWGEGTPGGGARFSFTLS